MKRSLFLTALLILGLLQTGCGRRDEDAIREDFVLADLAIKHQQERNFTAPATLEDLNKLVEEKGGWIDNPLRSDDEVAYAFTNKEPAPLTVEEALNMKSANREESEKVLKTLGRLPDTDVIPPKDGVYPGVDYSATLVRHSSADVSTFNPLLNSSTVDLESMWLTGIRPFGGTYDGFEPYASSDVNVSWQSSADHTIDKLVLRDDLSWSDGEPFTAYDIEFSYKVIMTSAVPISGERSVAERLLDVKAYDEHTLVVFHDQAKPINPLLIQFPNIPKHKYEESIKRDPTMTRSKVHEEMERNPIVAGPYYVESRIRSTEIVYRRNDHYYMHNGKQVRTKPMFERIRVKITPETATAFIKVKAGDMDSMQIPPELWEQTNSLDFSEKNVRVFGREWSYFAFWWNLSLPLFSDIRVREALDVAFDHDEMLRNCRRGLDRPCTGLFIDEAPWYPKDAGIKPLKRDVERAKQLLAEAGWTDSDNDGVLDKEIDGKRVPFAFTMISMNKPDRLSVCNLLKTNLQEVGIDMTVQAMEFNVWLDKMQNKTFQASMGGWEIGSDPYLCVNEWGTGAGRNWIHYSNPEVDRLFKEGEAEFDREKRMAIYQKLHCVVYADRPCTWLYCQPGQFVFSKKLRGLNFYARCPLFHTAWKPAASAE